jgi:hypothetical protein
MNVLLTPHRVREIVARDNGDLQLMLECKAFFGCADTADGSWQGPLVGYAKRVPDGQGGTVQMVGKKYYNFAMVERQPAALLHFARILGCKIWDIEAVRTVNADHYPLVLLGAPMGGLDLRCLTAAELMRDGPFPFFSQYLEKEVTQLKTEAAREESHLVFKRHRLPRGARVVLIEDVCNNFSTTEQIRDILPNDAMLIGIACAVNRSGQESWRSISVASAISAPTAQWREDDPIIQQYLASGAELIRDPKPNWARLEAAMQEFGIAA